MRLRNARTILLLALGGGCCGILAVSCGSSSGHESNRASAQSLTTSPAPPPVPQAAPAGAKATEWVEKGVRLKYPSDWRPKKNPDYELMLIPPGAAGEDRRITMDIPDLPPHLPWMIQMSRIEHDYLQDLRKKHPDLKEDDAADGKVPNSKSRLVRSSWHQNGKAWNDVALLMIHSDGVYILDAQSDADHLGPTRGAFDSIESSLQWTK